MKTVIARTEEERGLCYRMRYDVMCRELGWISGDRATPEERDEYDLEQSIDFLALDDEGEPIGTSRLIVEGRLPLPIERHFMLVPRDEMEKAHGSIASAAEGSRFIVPRNTQYRRHEVSVSMCHALIARCIGLGITHMFVSADHKVFRLLRMIGFPLERVGESTHYMGSETVPSIIAMAGWEEVIKKQKQKLKQKHEQNTQLQEV